MKKVSYKPKAIPTIMRAYTSATLKIRDNFFKVELQEERVIPEGADVDMTQEWTLLFDEINNVLDGQVDEIWDSLKNKK